MSNQYEVLGKAPTPDDLKKLSPNEVHLTSFGDNFFKSSGVGAFPNTSY